MSADPRIQTLLFNALALHHGGPEPTSFAGSRALPPGMGHSPYFWSLGLSRTCPRRLQALAKGLQHLAERQKVALRFDELAIQGVHWLARLTC